MRWPFQQSPDGVVTALQLLKQRQDALEAAWAEAERRLTNNLRSLAQRENELYKRELALQEARHGGGVPEGGHGGVRGSGGILESRRLHGIR